MPVEDNQDILVRESPCLLKKTHVARGFSVPIQLRDPASMDRGTKLNGALMHLRIQRSFEDRERISVILT